MTAISNAAEKLKGKLIVTYYPGTRRLTALVAKGGRGRVDSSAMN
ncbi:MAG TPA: hypothetical protein VNB54_13300 [Alphaproteobacteria bacterium]|nr:hypothetical protein [Alphaproteobacteria bacterium]